MLLLPAGTKSANRQYRVHSIVGGVTLAGGGLFVAARLKS
jgi:hypothetical protein